MSKTPEQRKSGQKGGGGNINHTESRVKSQDRGGKPYKGGAGKGKKAKG